MESNLYHICTLDPASKCNECIIHNKLHCKLDKNRQKKSLTLVLSTLIVTTIGILLTGLFTNTWWMIISYLLLFLLIIEPRLTCSHCPYYAEQKKILNCTSNALSPKFWRFHPEPMNKYEKIGSTIGFIFLAIFPIVTELYGIVFLITNPTQTTFLPLLELSIITLLSFGLLLLFSIIFLVFYCPYCLNFSCQFNKVPKNLKERYIEKNPVLKDAIHRSD